MIKAVTKSDAFYIRSAPEARQSDPLTAKRSEESRQLAIAAVNQQQRSKVQQAVASYMSVAPPSPADGQLSVVSLALAKGAYSEF
ncbi:MAG: hypothetical protein AB7L90_08075 [Hyphomicrobiaceae bacterium]